jgi:nicotinamidase/pyrazinamidase
MKLNAVETLLLIIDVQNDFCPAYTSVLGVQHGDGALAVSGGGEVIPPLNALARSLTAKGGRAAATQDWHPAGHISFASSHNNKNPGDIIDTALVKGQVLWPDHCVQGTWGAAFHDELDLKPVSLIIRKGFRPELDSYSAFFENDQKTRTGLNGWIADLGIKTVILGGLATDYCVFFSAMDCKNSGYNTIIASDAIRGVGIPDGSVEKAMSVMKDAGIIFASSQEILF